MKNLKKRVEMLENRTQVGSMKMAVIQDDESIDDARTRLGYAPSDKVIFIEFIHPDGGYKISVP